MSDKLNQALGDIITARRGSARPRRGARRVAGGIKKAAAPVGGVKKNTKAEKKSEKPAVPTGPARGESKVLISNLPSDVSEAQIKEYFGTTIGQVKKVMLSFNAQGQSRGIANVTFFKPDSAAKAVQELNTVKVDGRPMKVEVIVDAKNAPGIAPPKKLSDRIAQPKNAAKPKPATETKNKSNTKEGKPARGRGRGARGGRTGRVKKSAEELDAEMVDYFADPAVAQNGQASDAMADVE